jgi:hypothetical protein
MNIYIDKYTPTKSKDYIGHFKFINDFKNYLTNDHKTNNKIIICIGNTGIGKTSLLKTLFNELNYNTKEITDHNNYKEDIYSYLNNNSIDCYFKKINKLLFIDDLEIYLNNDKNINNYLLNLENKSKVPIVCVINKLYDRKINDLKKKATIFYLNKPPINNTVQLLLNIFDKENIEVDKEKLYNIKKIIKVYKSNIKLILLNLDNIILNKELSNCCYFDNNFNDIGLFDIVNNIFNKKYSILELNDIVYSDSNLICMLLHENLITELSLRRNIKKTEDVINIYSDILEDFCESDFIEKFVYSNNEWNLLNMLYIIKIFKLNNYVNNYEVTQDNVSNNFTQILTKYSIKCNYNKKKIKMFENINLSNELFDNINQNILYSLNNTNFKNLNNVEYLIKNYNINKDILDILNKYNKEFSIIDNKILNKLKKFIK